ncbi:hypothetical protein [Dyella flagellata]|uniref:hypothetical protein n=1 Tax=Dyella flagellata TaxID=1867833 RepID=UPI0024E0AEEF|nr:hypothetical protein [Dyella flagellata]
MGAAVNGRTNNDRYPILDNDRYFVNALAPADGGSPEQGLPLPKKAVAAVQLAFS